MPHVTILACGLCPGDSACEWAVRPHMKCSELSLCSVACYREPTRDADPVRASHTYIPGGANPCMIGGVDHATSSESELRLRRLARLQHVIEGLLREVNGSHSLHAFLALLLVVEMLELALVMPSI